MRKVISKVIFETDDDEIVISFENGLLCLTAKQAFITPEDLKVILETAQTLVNQ